MTADAQPGNGNDRTRFEAVDSKLTIYALANGMDLDKQEGSRRLSWFREGLERGALIELGGDGAFTVSAQAWRTGDESSATTEPVESGIAAADLVERLTALLESTQEAANGL